MPLRVSLFIDYQNAYHGARLAFHRNEGPASFGQIAPLSIGALLCERQPQSGSLDARRLENVSVYRGAPPRDTRMHDAIQRQIDQWRRDGITVVTRPLVGPPDRLREKGVDVELALDFFAGALDGDFDVGIIFSADADILPAFEKVLDPRRSLGVAVELATWWNPPAMAPRIARSLRIPHHRLTVADYERVRDRRNYTIPDE